MDAEMVDLVLESADTLKKMIESVHASLETESPKEGPTDIGPLIARIEHCIKQAEGLDKKPLGEILLSKGAVSEKDVKSALETQKQEKGRKIGEILVEENKVAPKEVVSALREQKRFSGPVALSVKIDTRKLDSVVDMVGELAIAQSILRQNEVIRTSRDRNLDRISSQLSQITSELQRTAMALRMEPIKNTFQKMLRLVRDLAKKAGKEVQLVMSGEDTEIDRNMVEEIYEPMVHMIRNSVDHGLETPQEREKAGKPRRGSIFLRAYHKGGDIVIEIEDDGKGLDRGKILEKAVANGLVKQGQKLTDAEINNLIFHPGFSTAEKITDISGRGVGMDVVKSKIVETLKGRLDVHSTPGKGTTVTIRLPLTLAIMDGMVISVSRQRYIIPTLNIQESFKPRETDYHTLNDKGEMMLVRNKLVPLIRLDRLFNHNGNMSEDKPERPPWERLVVVVENQERKLCLLIDELLGKEEVVIKSLGGWLKNVKGIAGGAIMGDGRVGLILDIGGILNIAFGEQ
ncbi:MAG: chemotaxis protein CheA [Deltaproteobacteria bacterium]|nr:chemotaxis protein CheA [Deltaproteobacteria bacterium]